MAAMKQGSGLLRQLLVRPYSGLELSPMEILRSLNAIDRQESFLTTARQASSAAASTADSEWDAILPITKDIKGSQVFKPPPKEHLIEKYFDPQHLSGMEKHRRDLQAVRNSFARHVADCGSSEVQIALLTSRIKHLAKHLETHRKDIHTKTGLRDLLSQRKRLMKYLRRTDWDAYVSVLSRLGIRDTERTVS